MPFKNFQKEKEGLLEILTEDEIKVLKKDYPFRQERNAKIYELKQKGISCAVLMELTGLCKNSILQIGQLGRNSLPGGDLIKIKTTLDVLSREIKKFLKQRRKQNEKARRKNPRKTFYSRIPSGRFD
jgi:hypothetical protein